MKVIAVVSAKGGVGKTTLAANLASVLANSGRRVIALDLDPQNALRLHFGVPLDSIDGLSRATLSGNPWQSVMFDGIDGVTVLPYGAVLEDDRRRFEAYLDQHPQWLAHVLQNLRLEPSDIVIVDTPPGSSVYVRAALTAATFALNIVLADAASYAAIPQMERMIDSYAAPRPEFGGVGYVVNQIDQSRQLTKDVLKVLRQMLAGRVFPGVIHLDEGVSEALACETTLIHYDPLSQAAADFRACGAWLTTALDAIAVPPRNVA
ncbi:cellulose synthase operon protein YhjQ [Burkholderia sp. SRS-W-2-2016]|uniref:cellulose biosynthesis protein BcsQ n=1 Tax=Burkholderia sp. SRS-W-2-2016 TaxID=1926878 RepID=UPI00094AB89B|nr:cellulose biosynthesis protein BcsQ [Burkholderia sp. SRS-W-2-2016]OLL28959.1 cellulose synthase operon protein YhjQ [Burkholderia sp. SRS-W-2-2016]